MFHTYVCVNNYCIALVVHIQCQFLKILLVLKGIGGKNEMLTCDIFFNPLNLTLLLYFKRYCKLNFKNKANF